MDGNKIEPVSKSFLKTVHSHVRNLPTDHPIHYLKVVQWISYNKDLISAYRKQERDKVKGALAKRISCEGYIRHMRHYLKHGDWIDLFYGADQEFKVRGVERS